MDASSRSTRASSRVLCDLMLVAGMSRNIFYIIGVIVVIVIVLKLLGLFEELALPVQLPRAKNLRC